MDEKQKELKEKFVEVAKAQALDKYMLTPERRELILRCEFDDAVSSKIDVLWDEMVENMNNPEYRIMATKDMHLLDIGREMIDQFEVLSLLQSEPIDIEEHIKNYKPVIQTK